MSTKSAKQKYMARAMTVGTNPAQTAPVRSEVSFLKVHVNTVWRISTTLFFGSILRSTATLEPTELSHATEVSINRNTKTYQPNS